MNTQCFKQPMVSLSFDDGRKDTFTVAYQIMKKYGLVGTLHITTGWVDKSFKPEEWFSAREGAMSISEIQRCYQDGFEITSHGDQHLIAADDLHNSLEKLKAWEVIDPSYLGFSFPNSKLGEDDVKILKDAHIQYARAGRSNACYSLSSKFFYILQNNFKLIRPFYAFNRYNSIVGVPQDLYHLPSTVIKSTNTAKQVIYFLEQSKKNNAWNILMLHSILEPSQPGYGKDCWYWPAEEFEKLCQWLSIHKEIKVVTIGEGIKECLQKNGQI